jgi:hypothetical protein
MKIKKNKPCIFYGINFSNKGKQNLINNKYVDYSFWKDEVGGNINELLDIDRKSRI